MISELKKSVSATLYERLTSPFYGTFVTAWLLWNWKIPYVTFFVSEKKLNTSKIEYISSQLSNVNFSVTYPIISTAVLILIFPFIANGAYLVSLRFDKWKREKRNEVENTQLLSIEESIALRESIVQQEERLDQIINNKDKEISSLKALVSQLQKNSPQKVIESKTKFQDRRYSKEYEEISAKSLFINNIDRISKYIQSGYGFDDLPNNAVAFFVGNDLIQKKGGSYDFTEKGKFFLKEFYNSIQ